MKSSTPWCISIGFGYQLAIPSRQEAKQRRRKNKSTKISVWFKVKKSFKETAMGGSQSVFSEQELSDYQVSFGYTEPSI